jgi:hypothetical protein
MAAISKNLAGKVKLALARDTVTTPSSSGCLSTSSASRENSGNSSMNSTPRWAREISPGLGTEPLSVSEINATMPIVNQWENQQFSG